MLLCKLLYIMRKERHNFWSETVPLLSLWGWCYGRYKSEPERLQDSLGYYHDSWIIYPGCPFTDLLSPNWNMNGLYAFTGHPNKIEIKWYVIEEKFLPDFDLFIKKWTYVLINVQRVNL